MALWAVWMMFWEAVCHPRDGKIHIFKDKSRLLCVWQWLYIQLTHVDVVVPREQWQGRYQKSLGGTGMRQQVYGGHTSALDASGRPCRTRGSKAVWSLHGCKVCAWHKDLLSPCTREGSVTDTFPGQEPSSSSSPFQVTHPISQKCNVPDTSHNKLP